MAAPPDRPRVLAWLSPSDPSAALPGAPDAVRELERAGLDLLVLEQVPGTARLDPVPALTAFAHATSRIGLVAGIPVADLPPFLLARALGTLDLVSGGRSGWLVEETRPALDVRDDTGRWQRAADAPGPEWADAVAEHVDTACLLWGSWEPDAVVIDRESGVFVDHAKVHPVDARGRFFSSRGPLNTPPPPQGRPVLLGTCAAAGGPGAAVDVVVVRSADPTSAAVLVDRCRRDGPALVLVAVAPAVDGTPNPAPAGDAVGICGDAATVAAELSRLVAMTGADGLVLCGALDVRTVAGTASAVTAHWTPAPPSPAHLRDRLLAVESAGAPS